MSDVARGLSKKERNLPNNKKENVFKSYE